MDSQQLEAALKDLPRIGTRVEQSEYQELWRFELSGVAYVLKFFDRRGFRASPALREFKNLQSLQRLKVPSPRAVATLIGFRLEQQLGDALVYEPISNAIALDQYLIEQHLRLASIPHRREITRQVCEIIKSIGTAKLGHHKLETSSFAIAGDRIYLTNAQDMHPGGIKLNEIMRMHHSVSHLISKTDLMRAWKILAPESMLPARNKFSETSYRAAYKACSRENERFGLLNIGDWSGVFVKRAMYPQRWARASQVTFSEADWSRAWPVALDTIQNRRGEVMKRDASGEVLAIDLQLGTATLSVVIKRPLAKTRWQRLREFGAASRARRIWAKTIAMLARGVACEYPLLIMERKRFGRVYESVLVFERVPGSVLALTDLDAIAPIARDMLFRRCGRALRYLESHAVTHLDAKSYNWIVFNDPILGPFPVMIDMYGIRWYRADSWGVRRLLRAMREHKQYTPADSLALCHGYAPRAPLTPAATSALA